MSDKFPIFKASNIISRIGRKPKYPWRDLEVGQSFAVSFDDSKEASLRVLAHITSKKLQRSFFVRKHDDTRVYEVGRLPDEMESETPQNDIGSFPQSFDATKHSVGMNEKPVEAPKPVAEEPWKSPILDPRINLANVVKRIEVPVEAEKRNEPEKSEWTLPKKEGE